MDITICICTHNRAEMLRDCLEGIAIQECLNRAWSVVDNNCRDNTQDVVESFRPRVPNLEIVSETNPGLSHARNRGIAEARTPFIAYLDDDAVPESGWLRAILEAFAATGAAAVGGRIIPYWKGPKPWWISQPLHKMLLAEIDEGDSTIIDDHFHPNGGNMAFRVDMLRETGGFDVRLGVSVLDGVSKTVYLGEESSIYPALIARGGKIAYTGKAVVKHRTDGPHSSFRGLRSRAAQIGRSNAAIGRVVSDPTTEANNFVWHTALSIACLIRVHWRNALVFHLIAASNYAALTELTGGGKTHVSRRACLLRAACMHKKALVSIAARALSRRRFYTPPE